MKHTFKTPYEFEGKEYSEIELDLDGLRGPDLEAIWLQIEDLTKSGQRVPLASSWKFIAAKAAKLPVDFFTYLPAREYLKLSGIVSPFFDN